MPDFAIVHHPLFSRTGVPSGHRFPSAKFARLWQQLRDEGLAHEGNSHEPEPAPRWWLELAHERDYVDDVLALSLDENRLRRIGLPLSDALVARARAAIGGTVLAGELALSHGLACNTAGGSHHAMSDGGAGFCLFNDVAVAARALQAKGLVRRLLIVDLDVHQGDGTAEIFRGDRAVFTFSMHAEKNYPVRKQQSDLDLDLPDGIRGPDYLARLGDHFETLLARERPDLVYYNAGVDPHKDDRLGRLALDDDDLAARDAFVIAACSKYGVPLATVMGGGYSDDVDALAARHALLFRAAAARPD